MFTTPTKLLELAIERHRKPWNWTIQFAGVSLLCLTLLAHSYLLLAASLILLGTGFLDLNMDDPPDNRWFKFVTAGVEWEKNWVALPWNFAKIFKFTLVMIILGALIWVLVVRELAAIGLFIGFVYLARVVIENKESGVEP